MTEEEKRARLQQRAAEYIMFKDDYEADDAVAMIFAEPQFGWGARGNPLLWNDLRTHFCNEGLPSTFEDFEKATYAYIETKIGRPFTEDTFVKEYDKGGMSSGMITPEWWRAIGIPELKKRYNSL